MNLPAIFTIVNILLFMAAVGLMVQTFIGLSFLISSVWEKERRATIFAAVQFSGMAAFLIIFLVLVGFGFFQTAAGLVLLIVGYIVVVLAAIFMVKRTAPNPRALQGTSGYIRAKVNRFDERMQVFARNRALPPGSEQYTSILH